MKTSTSLSENNTCKSVTDPIYRQQVAHWFLKKMKQQPFSKKEETEAEQFFREVGHLPFHKKQLQALFFKTLHFIATRPTLATIPLRPFWVFLLYEELIDHNWFTPLNKVYADARQTKNEALFLEKSVWHWIENILKSLFKEYCLTLQNKLPKKTNTLNTSFGFTDSLFHFWIFKNYPFLKTPWFSSDFYAPFQAISFEQLVRYLPEFMLRNFAAFCQHPETKAYIVHLASGENFRKADNLPFAMTKKMAHELGKLKFAGQGTHVTTSYPFIYAFVKGLGGTDDFFKLFYAVFRNINDYDFQKSVVLFFARFPDLQAEEIRALLGYISHRRQEDEVPFSMKGRTLASLRRAANAYYIEQERQMRENSPYYQDLVWKGVNYAPYTTDIHGVLHTITQLCSTKELVAEGANLSHCAASYTSKCAMGKCSIWSLRRQEEDATWTSLTTIEVNPQGQIVQAKGRFNTRPEEVYIALLMTWAKQEGLEIVKF